MVAIKISKKRVIGFEKFQGYIPTKSLKLIPYTFLGI